MTVQWKFEVLVLPVADIDRAKAYYLDVVGWELQVDYSPNEFFRVVHLIPQGSAVAIALMKNEEKAGSLSGIQLVVEDYEAARAQLIANGGSPSEPYHFMEGAQHPGPHPERGDYETFFNFSDPDGNEWLVQERRGF